MKGLVPVSKASLLEMVNNCRKQIDIDLATNKAERIDKYIYQTKKSVALLAFGIGSGCFQPHDLLSMKKALLPIRLIGNMKCFQVTHLKC